MAEIITPSEQEWNLLRDEKRLKALRSRAEERYGGLTSDQVGFLRKRAKNDLFFLASGVLGYDLLSENLHGHYANWLQRNWGERYRMSLLPRDHYKSTEQTITDSVQMALPNDAGVQFHPYVLGPNIKLLLSHENRESASRFLFEIAQAFMAKPLMLALFPECIPQPRIQRVNKFELDLPRDVHHKEPTFDTIGVGGAAQGRHYNWLKLDDIVGEEARDSETVMGRVLMWFDNINSLLTRLKIDGWDLTGTRWSANDVYAHAVRMYGVKKDRSVLRAYFQDDIDRMEDGQLVIYARGALEKGKPIFPEEFTIEDLNRIRKNPTVWAAQYANNPRASDLVELQPNWLKYYNVTPNGRITVFAGDQSWSLSYSDLDIVILIDPAMSETSGSDPSGVMVTGTDSKMNIYVLEAYKKRMKAPELMDELFRLYTRWNPRVVSIEAVNFSKIYEYWFRDRCNKLHIYPSIHPHKRPGGRGAKSKHGYIRALANYGAAGQIYILEGMHQLRDEWDWFPMGDGEHILDAFSQGPEVWTAAMQAASRDQEQAMKKLEELDDRDALTGYSSI